MQNMGADDGRAAFPDHHHHSEELHSGPLYIKRVGRKRARFSISPDSTSSSSSHGQEPYAENTFQFRDDSVAVQSIKAANSTDIQDQEDKELTVLARSLEEGRSSSSGSTLLRSVSSRITLVSQELKHLTLFAKKAPACFDRKKYLFAKKAPACFDRKRYAPAHALKLLEFVMKINGVARWAAIEKRFDDITASTNGILPRALFDECIAAGMNNESKEFAGELFDALIGRHSIGGDSITKDQLKEFWDRISDRSFDSRLQTFFDMVDKDANGRITVEEVKEIISVSASANKLSNIKKQAEEYAALIMEDLDPDNLGYIMTGSLEILLLTAPSQSSQLAEGGSRNMGKNLSQKLKPAQFDNPLRRCCHSTVYPLRRFCHSTKKFLLENWQRIWVIALWIGVMTGLFAYKYVQYQRVAAYEVMGHCVCMAKGAAETLKFNMALILFPVCRNTITWLRNRTKLGVVVPFDDNLNFHKVIAIGILIGVGIHATSHLACNFPRLLNASEEKYELMEPFFGDQPKSYWHFVKSVEGITGIVTLVLMAIAFTLATSWFRQNRLNLPKPLKKLTGFNAFWYSHHLFVIVYALLIVHGYYLYLTNEWYKKTTWMYLAIPLCLYACERLIRVLRSNVKPVKILKVVVYPGNVLALHMSKPQGFIYKSGQYMFVNCAAVSRFEWHPFSITSAPGDDYLSVHIRTLGNWTRQLKTVFSEVRLPGNNITEFPRIQIDGPFGAAAQDYKQYAVVLLVGIGVGATPMISIVKDIVSNMRAMEDGEFALEKDTSRTPSHLNSEPGRIKDEFKTRRAYFYWVTKERGSLEWFEAMMQDLEQVVELDHNNVVEINSYCTSVYEEGDARSALITMLQSLNYAKNGVDIVSGSRINTHFAKPNWRNVYKRIALKHTETKVGVFYCGGPALTKELSQLALDCSHNTRTKFDFHKQNF
ncbi:hypothetical protein ACOSQ2_000224 [Xanthoceras sorbifolium]